MQLFRIFVSSTFSDMRAEREALRHDVLPGLRELCRANGAQIQMVDLRWGVSEEAARDRRTMDICLEEIRRCQHVTPRPNFLALLGDRYGWRPVPAVIPASSLAAIVDRLRDMGDEAAADFVAAAYTPDDNAVPAECRLQPQRNASASDADLRSALDRAITGMDLPEPDRIALHASATEQEIALGALGSGRDGQAIAVIRTIAGTPTGAAAADFIDATDDEAEWRGAVEALKGRVRAKLEPKEFSVAWERSGIRLDHLTEFCRALKERLVAVICEELQGRRRDALEEERQAHADFAAERSRLFVGRTDTLARIESYVMSSSQAPLAIIGVPGSGKSTLMARAAEQAQQRHRDTVVLQRFIGVTPDSSNTRALLAGLCRELSRSYDRDEHDVPDTDAKLAVAFHQRLAYASSAKPLIVFIDALDQLDGPDAFASFPWIPVELPPFVRLIVTALPDLSRSLARVAPGDHLAPLPPLSIEEGDALLQSWLGEVGRRLTLRQKAQVMERFGACPLPLYLKLVFEQVRSWTSSDDDTHLGTTTRDVIEGLLDRLSDGAEHGPALVQRSLAAIAAARHGLAEDELIDILSEDTEVMQEFSLRSPHSPSTDTLPPIVWSRLYFDLAGLLSLRRADDALLLSFFHRELKETVSEKYLVGAARGARHRALASYFGRMPTRFNADPSDAGLNRRKLSEWPYHLAYGERWNELERALTSLEFLEAKAAADGPQSLVGDFDRVLRSGMAIAMERELGPLDHLALVRDAIQMSAHRLHRDPRQIAGQLIARLPEATQSAKLQHLFEDLESWSGVPWLRPVRSRLRTPGGTLAGTLAGHTGYVNGVCLLRDDSSAVSCGSDGTLKLWDMLAWRAARTRFEAHAAPVRAIAATSDGEFVVSGGEDGVARMWRIPTFAPVRSFSGHAGAVIAVTSTPDGRRVVTGSDDGSVGVWEAQRDDDARFLRGHAAAVRGVAAFPDGRHIISASADRTLRVWDLETGDVVGPALVGHTQAVTAVAISPDGNTVLSASEDQTLLVWDLQARRPVDVLRGHAGPVLAVAISSDGRLAASGAADLTVRIWNLDAGLELHTLTGHAGWPTAITFSRDGRRVITGSDDATLKIWTIVEDRRAMPAVVAAEGEPIVMATTDGVSFTAWDVDRGAELPTHPMQNATPSKLEAIRLKDATITSIAATPDERFAASGSSDGTVKLWDIANLFEVARFSRQAIDWNARTGDSRELRTYPPRWPLDAPASVPLTSGHRGPVTAVAIAPDGEAIASCGVDRTLRIWNVPLHREVLQIHATEHGHRGMVRSAGAEYRFAAIDPPSGIAFTSGGARAVTVSSRDLQVWDTERWDLLFTLPDASGRITSLSNHPSLHQMVASAADGTLRFWNLSSGRLEQTIAAGSIIVSAGITPDGRLAAYTRADGRVHLYELERRRPLGFIDAGHIESLNAVVVLSNRVAVSGSNLGFVRAWDLVERRETWTVRHDETEIVALACDRMRRLVVSASRRSINVWRIADGALHHVRWIDTPARALAIAASAGMLVAGSADGRRIERWGLAGGDRLEPLPAIAGICTSVAITADGRRTVATHEDGTVQLWDASAGAVAAFGLDEPGSACGISDDGETVVAGDLNGRVHLFRLRP